MTSETLGSNRFTIDALLRSGIIIAHKDGNYGSLYPRVSDFGLAGVPFITAKSLTDGRIDIAGAPRLAFDKAKKLTYGFVRPRDVLLSHNATIGRVAVVPDFDGEMLVGTSLTYYRVDQTKLIPLYLAAFFSSVDFQNQLKAVMGLSTRNQVPITAQRKLNVVIPPIKSQRYIADTLGTLDDRISMLRETNATLEAIAQALFKSWFVDFDPVRAKAEGLEPEGMDAATAALFPDSFEECAMGMVPKGWNVGALADLANLNPESWTARNRPASVAYIDLANAKENVIAEITEYPFEDAPSRARRVLRDGDTIVGTVRPGNRSFAFIANADTNLTGSTGFAVLRPILVESTEFVYLSATSDTSIEYLTHIADGGAYPAVRPEVVSSLQSILPDLNVLRVFHDTAVPIFMKIAGNHQQAEALAQLRDALLPRLISGQLRLPEAEEMVEEVCA